MVNANVALREINDIDDIRAAFQRLLDRLPEVEVMATMIKPTVQSVLANHDREETFYATYHVHPMNPASTRSVTETPTARWATSAPDRRACRASLIA